jgi:hypothetical protein
MKVPVSQWRGWVCVLLLFFFAAFIIEAREFVNFAQTFSQVHNTWLPVQAHVDEVFIATSERRSGSTRTGAVGHITRFTFGAKVRYTIDGQAHGIVALAWEEPFGRLSQWGGRDLHAGATTVVRVSPSASDHATLIGEWNPVSTTVFARLLTAELALIVAMIVCGRFAIRRAV